MLLNQGGGLAERGKSTPESFSQGNAPETLTAFTQCQRWGLHGHPGGLGSKTEPSAQSHGTELSMSWHSSAAFPCSTPSQVLS